LILDTSVALDFIWEREPISTELANLMINSNEDVYMADHQLAEISDVATRNKGEPEVALAEIGRFVQRVTVTQEDLVNCGTIKWTQRKAGKNKFSLADAVMLAVGRRLGETVVTKDTDFAGLEGVTLLG
jgi:predicted nucleic acid-binding protein